MLKITAQFELIRVSNNENCFLQWQRENERTWLKREKNKWIDKRRQQRWRFHYKRARPKAPKQQPRQNTEKKSKAKKHGKHDNGIVVCALVTVPCVTASQLWQSKEYGRWGERTTQNSKIQFDVASVRPSGEWQNKAISFDDFATVFNRNIIAICTD